MSGRLAVSVGQYSDRGRKPSNQDYHGVYIAKEPQLSAKGLAVAVADGISSSDVSHVASQAAVTGFLLDYYCTSEAWSVKKSVQKVLFATNSWLYAQTRSSRYCYDKDRGYVCTFSALVVKSATAYLFHVGDSRIYRWRGGDWEQLTNDHRLWVSPETSYLSRALGMDSHLELDYRAEPVECGDLFVLATDGVYEFVEPSAMAQAVAAAGHDLDAAAKAMADAALAAGSGDNLTVQLVRIEQLPQADAEELLAALAELPFPPPLRERMEFDGYTVLRELHVSSRSHVHLAIDNQSRSPVVIKSPSIDLRGDPAYLERFLMEDWIARRIDSPYVLKPCPPTRKRNFLYVATEFVDGRTLAQWMLDHPQPALEAVRAIVEQIAKGLRAFHRLEMLHQDLRPQNVMIDHAGGVKIIDFGSVRVAGVAEILPEQGGLGILGTAQYTAPEYFLGEPGTPRSDLYSLAAIAYQMLSGRLPYGAEVAKCRSRQAQYRLRYEELHYAQPQIPLWVDDALRKALHPDPNQRYADIAEFVHDLRQPNPGYLRKARPALIERNPLAFWKALALLLALLVFGLSLALHKATHRRAGQDPAAASRPVAPAAGP
ncbi:bifunctional protein-serine/threonine kinase/phosphatase [Methylomonas sp. SURF-1]|uniref:Bifunctional protein-serine/threonine kinase/phosphatase n=1 Tax=Methylomonas aurea TaxID=2952224 RepID=A0ABT1UHN8_9GAMM|nr:bifunctional protein-serine/threonine kinase/phosphatase [Methylomonas sp. SURF-1]MCQ8181219.1 bifunctional protein-serine/threonine kinase/phosphatase [Methylomonas sp. SURF-1]